MYVKHGERGINDVSWCESKSNPSERSLWELRIICNTKELFSDYFANNTLQSTYFQKVLYCLSTSEIRTKYKK